MITQADIDHLRWFHDFDFPGGLTARSATPETVVFRHLLWAFIRDELTRLNLAGKTVIDVGCWDGLFSFLAEELGAASVLAVDDFSQNWGSEACFHLARQLKGSQVTLRSDVSVYELRSRVEGVFDVVLCLGVYYHLHAPYLALAQLRSLCHAESVVVLEGECLRDDDTAYARCDLSNPHASIFVPTTRLLVDMLASCYLQVEQMAFLSKRDLSQALAQMPKAELIRHVRRTLQTPHSVSATAGGPRSDRVLIVARPIEGYNPAHTFRPPFGLAQYDPRRATKWHEGETVSRQD